MLQILLRYSFFRNYRTYLRVISHDNNKSLYFLMFTTMSLVNDIFSFGVRRIRFSLVRARFALFVFFTRFYFEFDTIAFITVIIITINYHTIIPNTECYRPLQ